MADVKISQLPQGQTLDGTEKLAAVQSGVTIATTVAQVIAGALARSGHTGTQDISTIDGLQAALDAKLGATATATSATALAVGADRTKLDSITSGATANSSDASLRDRSTHTGTQAVSTVAGLQGLLDAKAPLASPTFSGTVSGSFSGPLAGNAATASALSAGADRTKLDNLSVISQDFVLARANHTGTQPISTVAGLQAALDDKASTGSQNFSGTITAPAFVGPLTGNASTASGLADGSDKTKLDGIQAGATVNSSDAALRDRSTHTGTQGSGTISMASGRLIGRATAGAGPAEEITLGDGLSFVNGVLTASATGGGLTNLEDDLSPTLGGNLDVDGFSIKGSTGIVFDTRFAVPGDDYASVAIDARDGIFLYSSDPDQVPLDGPTVLAKGDSGNLVIGTDNGDIRLLPSGGNVVCASDLDIAGGSIKSNTNAPLVVQPYANQPLMLRGKLRVGPADFTTGANDALILSSDTSSNRDSTISLRKHHDTAFANLTFRRSKGSEAVKTPMTATQPIGKINFDVFDGGTTFYTGVSLSAESTEDHSATAAGSHLNITTIEPGTITPVRRMFIGSPRTSVYGKWTVEPVNSSGEGNSILAFDPAVPSIKLGPNLYPMVTGSDGQVLTTDGAGTLSWTTPSSGGGGIAEVAADTSPSLGGDLEIGLNKLISSNGMIQLKTEGAVGYPGGAVFVEGSRISFNPVTHITGPNYHPVTSDPRPEVTIETNGDADLRLFTGDGAIVLEPGGGNPAVQIGGLGILSGKPNNSLWLTNHGGQISFGGSPNGTSPAPSLYVLGTMQFDGVPKFYNRLVQTDAEGTRPIVDMRLIGTTTGAASVALTTTDAATGYIETPYAPITIPTGQAATFQVLLTGLRTDVAGDIASFVISGLVRNDGSGASIVNQTQQIIHRTDDNWAASAGVSGNELKIYVAGSVGETVKWTAAVRLAFAG